MNLMYTGTHTDDDEHPIYVDTHADEYVVLDRLQVVLTTESLKEAREFTYKAAEPCARCGNAPGAGDHEPSGMCRPCELLTKDEERRDFEDMRDGDAFALDHCWGQI